MEEEIVELQIERVDVENFDRLDLYLVSKTTLSRSRIKALFEKNKIVAENGEELTLKKMPTVGTKITVELPEPIPTKSLPENIPLKFLYEDHDLAFIFKPAGMVTHPAPGNYTGTLVNAILYHCKDLQGIGDELRPGIVHRLDKGTSGVMIIAKNQDAHIGLAKLFAVHDIKRVYHCIAVGPECPVAGTLKSTIGRHPTNRLKQDINVRNGKEAITHYKLLKQVGRFKHFEITLETGRTHQIRVHLSRLLHQQILMDPLYGNPGGHLAMMQKDFPKWKEILENYEYPLLHAKTLGLVHPRTNEYLEFSEEPPSPMKDILELMYEEE